MRLSGHHRPIEGIRLFWHSSGSGPPLVLIHGFMVSHLSWAMVGPSLAKHFSLVAPDLPGFGESDQPERFPYTVESFSHVVAVLLDALGLSRVDVIGHSLGSAIAMDLAVRYPERVNKLVMVSPIVFPFQFPIEGRLALMPIVGEFIFKKIYAKRDMKRYFRKEVYFDPQLPAEETLQYYWDRFSPPAGRAAAYKTLKTMNHLQVLDGLPSRVSCPTLVVWGEEDRLVPEQHIQRLSRTLRNVQLSTMPKTGHPPMEERPEKFCAATIAFLKQ